jgi:hypothetical protein
MNQQQNDGPALIRDLKTMEGWVTGGIHCWGSAWRLWACSLGSLGFRFSGLNVLGGLAIPFLLTLCCDPAAAGDAWIILWFWATVGLAALHKCATFWREKVRGARIHNYCMGLSWFWLLLPAAVRCSATVFAAEALTAVLLGSYVYAHSQPLGLFILLGGTVMSPLSGLLIHWRDRRIIGAVKDAALMQRYYAEEARKQIDDL